MPRYSVKLERVDTRELDIEATTPGEAASKAFHATECREPLFFRPQEVTEIREGGFEADGWEIVGPCEVCPNVILLDHPEHGGVSIEDAGWLCNSCAENERKESPGG